MVLPKTTTLNRKVVHGSANLRINHTAHRNFNASGSWLGGFATTLNRKVVHGSAKTDDFELKNGPWSWIGRQINHRARIWLASKNRLG